MICVITGDVGIGKSTVCGSAIEKMQRNGYRCDGIFTEKRDPFLVVRRVLDGAEAVFAEQKRPEARPGLSRYEFLSRGFRFGNRILERAASADILVIDEAGSLELSGGGFSMMYPVIAGRTSGAVLLVIRKKLLHKFEKRLDCFREIFHVTEDTRADIGDEVVDCLTTIMHR